MLYCYQDRATELVLKAGMLPLPWTGRSFLSPTTNSLQVSSVHCFAISYLRSYTIPYPKLFISFFVCNLSCVPIYALCMENFNNVRLQINRRHCEEETTEHNLDKVISSLSQQQRSRNISLPAESLYCVLEQDTLSTD